MKKIYLAALFFCLMSVSLSAQLVEVVDGLSFPFGLVLDDNDLYVSQNDADKISKFDITDTDPMLEDVLITSSPAALILKGDSLFIGKSGSISKINITDDMPVEELVVSDLSGAIIGFALDGNTLYYTNQSATAIFSLDLSQPGTPPVTVASGFNIPFDLELKGSDLYVSDFSGSISKIDLTAAPATVSTVVTGLTNPGGMTFNGNFLYVAENSRVSRIDINQDMPTAETVVTGLEASRLVAFDGIDMYIAEVISSFGGNGKISKLTIGTPVFSNLGTVCTGTVWTDLGGASPTGGTYSGTGVTDNGDGETFTFDPAAAGGVGSYTITYTAINGESITSTLEVTTPPTATFTAPGPFEPTDAAQLLTGGMPMGGTYSGMGVVDNGDGTFSFDPMAVGEGTYTITYTFEDDNGCTDEVTQTIEVECVINLVAIYPIGNTVGEFSLVGEVNGRNSYSGGVSSAPELFTISWSGTRWEISGSGTGVIHTSDFDTSPNPPDLATGNWQNIFSSDMLIQLDGCGTQAVELDFPAMFDPLCVDAGVQTGLGGGTPTGGVYSGPGVTDDGNGMTFSFDPAAAGAGVQTISYGGGGATAATATIEVFALPIVTFDAPGPFNTNDGLQPLTQGMPMGGTYSGMGVVDNGDGTFSFDPMAVGEGTYTITYTFEDDNGCSDAAMDDIVVEVAVPTTFELTIDTLCLPLPGDFATGLGGGMPEGGVYSGDGVMDDGNGMTFTFDPAAIDFSSFVTVTYTVNGQSATDDLAGVSKSFAFSYVVNGQTINLFSSTVSNAPDAFATINFGDGSPEETFTDFDFPSHTYEQAGTYEVCATQFVIEGCDSTFCQTVVIEPFLPGDVCGDATSIDSLFNRPQNVAYTSPLFTNVNYTTDDSDPEVGFECFGEPDGNGGAPSLERTRWFTFVGDGNMYYITTVECSATDYIDFGDTQIAIYTGDCEDLVASACNEDGPDAMPGGPFPAGLEFQTEEGVEYRMMIDGFGPDFEADGEFCIQVTNLSVTSVDDIFGTPYQVFPNPTKGALNITGITPDVVRIQDSYGKLIRTVQNNTNEFSIDDLPNGVYFIQVSLDGAWSTSRIVKQ